MDAKRPDWHIISRISSHLFILCRNRDGCVRYAPLYVHTLALCAPRKLQEAAQFAQRHQRYEEIQTVPDRLRWCRHSRGLTQSEVAERTGITTTMYSNLESGITQQISPETADRLAQLYGVPAVDFLDEFSRFLHDGQAAHIRACREKLGMGRKSFARHMGIPLTSLREWEEGRKTISRKSWERYFKDRA